MSHTIRITLDVTVKKMNKEEAEQIGVDEFDRKHFDIEMVDQSEVSESIMYHISSNDFCPQDDWPWKISKLERII